ncbi:unnamed protein product [Thelazia callipaeda]|uniref:DDE_Tnp_1_7 domain-containing protein n=1 Tax=Thelazia callipaeda TaxID=103827 RepID=A0A0N5DCC0_THECL|nr:unnamed protein product [Thelazia callipaeda]
MLIHAKAMNLSDDRTKHKILQLDYESMADGYGRVDQSTVKIFKAFKTKCPRIRNYMSISARENMQTVTEDRLVIGSYSLPTGIL